MIFKRQPVPHLARGVALTIATNRFDPIAYEIISMWNIAAWMNTLVLHHALFTPEVLAYPRKWL